VAEISIQTVFVVVRRGILFLQQATARWRPRWRPVSPDIDMYTKSLQKKGDMLKSILPSTETIDSRREFLVPWSLGSSIEGKSYSRCLESSHPLFRRSLLPSDYCPPRATVNRNIAMLPTYNSIPHFSKTNLQPLSGPGQQLSITLSVRNVSSFRVYLAGRIEEEGTKGFTVGEVIGLGRPHDQHRTLSTLT
jgi:hypothetical protein